jgi:predicted transcriptional regulator
MLRKPTTAMDLPQEIDVYYTIPAVRRELAQRLVKQGLTQRDVARRLGVTEAAVSQYMSNKRGITYEYPREVAIALDGAAAAISGTEDVALVRRSVENLCVIMKEHKVICELHKQHDKTKDGCSTCYE